MFDRFAPEQEDWSSSKKVLHIRGIGDIAYVEWGCSRARPVVLIHGFTSSSRSWSLMAPYLTEHRFIAVDLRGHGSSEKTKDDLNLVDLGNDICQLLDFLGIERADFVGCSLGSMVATTIAIYHPKRVNSLTLISTTVRAPSAFTDFLHKVIADGMFPFDSDGDFITEWMSSPTPVDQAFLKFIQREAAALPYDTWRWGVAALELSDLSKAARRINVPTSVLWGDQDQIFGVAEQEAVIQCLPSAKWIVYKGVGHSMTWEIPEVIAADIVDFLRAKDPSE